MVAGVQVERWCVVIARQAAWQDARPRVPHVPRGECPGGGHREAHRVVHLSRWVCLWGGLGLNILKTQSQDLTVSQFLVPAWQTLLDLILIFLNETNFIWKLPWNYNLNFLIYGLIFIKMCNMHNFINAHVLMCVLTEVYLKNTLKI